MKRLAVFAATLSLGVVGSLAAAGEASANASYWRTIHFTHGKKICLAIQSKASTSKGKREQIQKCNDGTAQVWRMDFAKYNGTVVATLHPASDTGKCLDGAKTEKTGSEWLLHATKCGSSTTQKWKYVTSDTSAYWGAQNYKTGLCIAPHNKSNKVGTWIVTAKCNSKTSGGQILQSK
ncbi:RICIN domain-containing protein [Streptomyces sp. NPDC058464]|uniref:RICIN domain-containing protein n=1 Tax=Streptomyces sp. NPDC058464 TaxID=3346511 RepID=UPI00364FE992